MESVRQHLVLELSLVCYNNAVMNLSDILSNDYCYDTYIPGVLQTHMCCDLQLLYPFTVLFINCCSNQLFFACMCVLLYKTYLHTVIPSKC